MKQEELLRAIGALDESMLLESEGYFPRPKRLLWRAVTAAALIGIMAVTAAAVGNLFLDLNHAPSSLEKQDITWVSYEINKDGTPGEELARDSQSGILVRLEIPTNPDAPILLKSAYVPTAPGHWVSCGAGFATTDRMLSQFTLVWEPSADEDGIVDSVIGPECSVEDTVSYHQYSAYFYNKEIGGKNVLDVLSTIPDQVEVTSRIVTLGGISMLRVDIPAFSLTIEDQLQTNSISLYMASGETRLYWSDGNSIFDLVCPGWMEDSEIEAFLNTLHSVEDIETYLNTAWEEYEAFLDANSPTT